MNSIIAWVGGKKRLREQIIDEFPKEKLGLYVEVFGGAGWVLLARDKHAKYEVYNDINKNLSTLFKCVKYHREELEKEIEFNLYSRDEFNYQKKILNLDNMTDIQRSAIFFSLIKHSFGSKGLDFATRGRSKIEAISRFKDLAKRLDRVVIENKDFEELLSVYDRKDTLFYLDPPYYNSEKYYKDYGYKFDESDHLRLKSALDKVSGKWILSYNDNDFTRELYKNYNILEVERKECLSSDYNDKQYKELIIKNY